MGKWYIGEIHLEFPDDSFYNNYLLAQVKTSVCKKCHY